MEDGPDGIGWQSWQTVGESNYGAVKKEQELTLKEDYTPLKWTGWQSRQNQLLQIKEATGMKNIYPQEHEADVHRKKKTLVQSLRQFHTYFYWLYEKGTTYAMVSPQGLHLGDALRCLKISASMGMKSFCPWCYKFRGNTETIAIHFWEVYYQMAIV